MSYHNDSHVFDRNSYKNENIMLNETNYDRKSDALSIDADFFYDPLVSSHIPNKLDENIPKVSYHDVISNVICSYYGFSSGGKLGHWSQVNSKGSYDQCRKYVVAVNKSQK